MKTKILKLLAVSAASCIGPFAAVANSGAQELNLHELDPDAGVRESGAALMALPLGLNLIEPETENANNILIGVHGWGSAGLEWIYPLQTIDDESTQTYFLRWDYSQCARESSKILDASIEEIQEESDDLEKITLVGHSLGGVLVAQLVELWDSTTPTDIHTIAAPLAGMGDRLKDCGPILPDRIPATVRFFQWRTQHELDGAFKDLEEDPQVVDLVGSLAVTLPETYRGRRLGHNWAISWVAERIVEGKTNTGDDQNDGVTAP